MQRITVINIKGGCGKTTIATNLASAYANQGRETTLIDFDPQGSSTFWLNLRPEEATKITGITAFPDNTPSFKSWKLHLKPTTERVIIDTPAGLKGLDLIDQIDGSHVVVVPVLPSSIDIHATANFIRDLYLIAKIKSKGIRLCIVCNRVKRNTLSFQSLERFLETMNIDIIGSLRETQNYNKASESGLGIHELKLNTSIDDSETWLEITTWLDSCQPERHYDW